MMIAFNIHKNLYITTLITILITSCLSVWLAQAKTYYKWTDKAGKIHITDHAPSPGEAASVNEVEAKERPQERSWGNIGSQKMGIGSVDVSASLKRLQQILPNALRVGDTDASTLFAQLLFMLLLFNLCLYLIARRTHVSYAWLSWIPLVNIFPFVGAAGYIWYVGLFFIIIPCLAFVITNGASDVGSNNVKSTN